MTPKWAMALALSIGRTFNGALHTEWGLEMPISAERELRLALSAELTLEHLILGKVTWKWYAL
jgi:hypothetical protein